MLDSFKNLFDKPKRTSLSTFSSLFFALLGAFFFLFPPQFGFVSAATLKEAQGLMEQGNNSYADKKYEQAIDAYQKVINLGYESTPLFYNLGNSYYREGKIGFAILYYEKALKLSPGNSDVLHNLAIANAKTIDKIDAMPKFFLFQWWESLLEIFSVTGWSYVVFALYLLLLLSIGIYFFAATLNIQRYSVYLGLTLAVFLIMTAAIWIVNLNREWHVKDAVVIDEAVPVKLAPDSTSGDAFVIHEGLKVRELDNVGKWVNIRLQDGKEGWALRDELGAI